VWIGRVPAVPAVHAAAQVLDSLEPLNHRGENRDGPNQQDPVLLVMTDRSQDIAALGIVEAPVLDFPAAPRNLIQREVAGFAQGEVGQPVGLDHAAIGSMLAITNHTDPVSVQDFPRGKIHGIPNLDPIPTVVAGACGRLRREAPFYGLREFRRVVLETRHNLYAGAIAVQNSRITATASGPREQADPLYSGMGSVQKPLAQELELVLAEARSLRWASGALGSPFIFQHPCYKQRTKASICFERESRNLPLRPQFGCGTRNYAGFRRRASAVIPIQMQSPLPDGGVERTSQAVRRCHEGTSRLLGSGAWIAAGLLVDAAERVEEPPWLRREAFRETRV
jgi:hypothetical protein